MQEFNVPAYDQLQSLLTSALQPQTDILQQLLVTMDRIKTYLLLLPLVRDPSGTPVSYPVTGENGSEVVTKPVLPDEIEVKVANFPDDIKVNNWPKTISDDENPDGILSVQQVGPLHALIDEQPIMATVTGTVAIEDQPILATITGTVTVDGPVDVTGSVRVTNDELDPVHVKGKVSVDGDVKVRNPLVSDDPPIPLPLLITGAVLTSDLHIGAHHVIVENTVDVDVVNEPTVHVSGPVHVVPDGEAFHTIVDSFPEPVPVTFSEPVEVTGTVAISSLPEPIEVTGSVTIDGDVHLSATDPVKVVPQLPSLTVGGDWKYIDVNCALPMPVSIIGPDFGPHEVLTSVDAQYNKIDGSTGDRTQYVFNGSRLVESFIHSNASGARTSLASSDNL